MVLTWLQEMKLDGGERLDVGSSGLEGDGEAVPSWWLDARGGDGAMVERAVGSEKN